MTPETAREYTDTLQRFFKDKLSEWEDTFVRSIQDRVNAGEPLSPRQAQKLDDLMERVAKGYGR